MKERVKERAILQEKITEGRINGKNAMTVSDINELKGHRGSAVNGIHVSTGRAKATMTTKRNEFPFVAVRTVVRGADIRRIATMHHFIYIFNNGFARMQGTKRVDKVTSVRGASNYADRNIK